MCVIAYFFLVSSQSFHLLQVNERERVKVISNANCLLLEIGELTTKAPTKLKGIFPLYEILCRASPSLKPYLKICLEGVGASAPFPSLLCLFSPLIYIIFFFLFDFFGIFFIFRQNK